MNAEIISEPLTLHLHGFEGISFNRDYVRTAFRLMDKMWQVVKSNNLENKGINIWVYEKDHKVFSGVELNEAPNPETGLEQKNITLLKYAYYKHIGPYDLIKQVTQNIKDEMKNKGFEVVLPHVEIYGHWTDDEKKLETELLMSLK